MLLLLFPLLSWGADCESVKKVFQQDGLYQSSDIVELKKGVDRGDMCFKNLMGIMVYKGIYFPKDISRAEDIFSDLSNEGYPEAQFNYALLMTKKLDQDPELIVNLIIGIYYKYSDNKKSSIIASDARDLGRKYTESLPELAASCNGKEKSCGAYFSKLNLSDIARIQDSFNNAVRDAQYSVAAKRLNLSNETEKQANTLITILSLGLLIYNLNVPTYSNGASAPSINGTEVWLDKSFGRRPLHLNTYQFPGTFW